MDNNRKQHLPFSNRVQSGGFRPEELERMRQICEAEGLKPSFTELVRHLLSNNALQKVNNEVYSVREDTINRFIELQKQLNKAFGIMFTDDRFEKGELSLSNEQVQRLLMDYAEKDPFATIDQDKCFPLPEASIEVYNEITGHGQTSAAQAEKEANRATPAESDAGNGGDSAGGDANGGGAETDAAPLSGKVIPLNWNEDDTGSGTGGSGQRSGNSAEGDEPGATEGEGAKPETGFF